MKKFYAHSVEEKDKKDWQLLSDHLIQVGKLAAKRAAFFDASGMAEIAGLLHDIGKYTDEFQKRLEGGPRCNHSTRGAILAQEKYQGLGTLLAYVIAGHHTGLMNGIEPNSRTTLNERIRAELPALDSQWQNEIQLPKTLAFPNDFKAKSGFQMFQFAFFTRMLFSSLVDSDFIDTEAFYNKAKELPQTQRDNFPSLTELKAELDKTLAEFQPTTKINETRCNILNSVRAKHTLEKGIFSLNVPTGGGKTLTSLAFALDHAIKNKLRRIIYVIPFTSIIEQNAEVFRDAFGDLGKLAVLEHHSAFVTDPSSTPKHLQNAESKEKLKLAMENWEAPIIVTTSVQFFESLFADRSSRCRKLHNIAKSVVILDEVQVLPTQLLQPCVAALDELERNYQTSLVLCTATQPALGEKDGFKNGLTDIQELAPEPEKLHQELERFTLKHIGIKTDEELAEEIANCNQVLCIVNNRRHASVLSQLVEDQTESDSPLYLTTLMCAEHRSKKLKQIRARLADANQPCRVISTSLIEAGVDLDFATVYRAEAGIDSIAQAGGRCNRNGNRPANTSELRVFEVGSDWKMPDELLQCAQVGKGVFRRFGDKALSMEAIHSYFSELFWQKGSSGLDASNILGMLKDKNVNDLPFETLSEKFKMIKSHLLPVIIPFDKTAENAIDALQHAENIGGIARTLQRYLVQIPEQGFLALKATGVIQAVAPEKFGEQFMQLTIMDGFYDENRGLNWDNPDFISAEKLVP